MAMEALKKTVLSKFSAEVGENVANLMIKEVVANVDRPGMGVRLVEEGELEWIMQVIDYSLQLGLANNRDFETVQSAVRVYVAWLTTITSSPHPSAPTPMIKSPLNYFSRLLDSLLAIFLPRSTENLFPPTIINRQAAEIRQVLGAVRVLYKRAEMAQKENIVEMWSRILLFLKSANSILLSKPCWPDELGSVMAGDLSENLFDCWVVAAIQGRIPTKSYWKMLSINAQQWITHVPVIEWWGRKLLALTVIVVKKSFGEDYCDIKLTDDIYNNIDLSDLKEIWWQLFTLFGNVSKIPGQAEKICLENGTSPNLGLVVAEQAGLSFFLTLEIMARIVSIFNADVTVSLDLHENDDIMAQCIEYQNVNGTSSNGTRFQRQSNMSTTSSNFSTAVDKNEESQSTLTSVQHQSGNLKKIQIAMNSQGSAKNGSLGKPIVNPSPVPNRNAKFSAKAGLHHATK
ncbi:unnamed protein product [Bursaphelenchus okinawaensis]|uniref:Ral GTPase-activating protein subunit alpha/beta N-terminal domain-containing protein n=1 Tax=Bursaphelenchus okinawaensis TaxID=465554 RepID=A0A811KBE8_9BILA|nr:unnamed protein product [Bursaphelenchus okinawaensis]CAG9099071.1 unnamed protein product [Bursaphelenchus okinawaensis]